MLSIVCWLEDTANTLMRLGHQDMAVGWLANGPPPRLVHDECHVSPSPERYHISLSCPRAKTNKDESWAAAASIWGQTIPRQALEELIVVFAEVVWPEL